MRVVRLTGLLLLGALVVGAQEAPKSNSAAPPAETGQKTMVTTVDVGKMLEEQNNRVVAVIDGKSFTAKDIEDFLRSMSPNVQTNFKHDPQAFLHQFAMLVHFEKLAKDTGFDQKFPYKQRLEYQRRTYLFEAQLDQFNQTVDVTDAERRQYFEQHEDNYKKGYFKVIYIAFNPSGGGSGATTEEQAHQKAEKAAAEAHDGADFVELVKKYSDDAETKGKDGDFGPFTGNDPSVPPAIRTAIFKLKPGEISEPLRHKNGFYIFRAEKFDQPNYEDVRGQLGEPIRRQKMDAWVRSQREDIQLEIKDKAFFEPAGQPESK